MDNEPITLAQLLEILGYTDGEHFTLNTSNGNVFRSLRLPYHDADFDASIAIPTDRDVWHSVNPVAPTLTEGRGKATDVTRLAALPADLDVKPGGCHTFDDAWGIIGKLSEMLNCDPSAVILSGHGLQPYWPIESEPFTGDHDRQAAQAILRRWGRLVRHVAEEYDAHVDSIFDLARVLRTPGSVNHKDAPKPVIGVMRDGHPLELDEIDVLLDEWGATEQPGDTELTVLGAVVNAPDGWQWAQRTCIYASKLIEGWNTDTPQARHPWLISQATRLAALHANGCLDENEHEHARVVLARRFHELLERVPVRSEHLGEFAEALSWGIAKASTMSADEISDELGRHPHLTALDPFGTGLPAPDVPQDDAGGALTADGSTAAQPDALASVETRAASYGATEDGAARALVTLHGDTLRYCPERSCWLSWDGTRWRWDHAGRHRELIRGIARSLPYDGEWKSFRRRALSSAGVTGIAALAATDPACVVHIGQLDARPWELNTPGGIVDLRTGDIRDCDPTALHTRCTPTAPDFASVSDVFASFLRTTFGTVELAQFVQRLFGVVAIGNNQEQILPFFYGSSGSNGKSTLLDAVAHALGIGDDHYAIAVNSDLLLARTFNEHPAEIAQLAGVRLAMSSEVEDGARFAEARVKQYTGSDYINARFMRGNPFTFKPTHTFIMLGNSRPNVASGGDAFWRRCLLVPFEHTVSEDERDVTLPDRLEDDAGVILAWIIRGAADYVQNGGLRTPAVIDRAISEYRHEQDSLTRFIEDDCMFGTDYRIPQAELFMRYEKFCDDNGVPPLSKITFGKRMQEKCAREGFEIGKSKTNSVSYWTGVSLAGYLPPDADSPFG